MSDYPNGRPPGQNNLDAGSPAYVAPENDPSAGAQKPDEVRAEEDGIETGEQKPLDPKVAEELDQASKNVVEPSSAENEKDNADAKSQPIDVDKPEQESTKVAPQRTPANAPKK